MNKDDLAAKLKEMYPEIVEHGLDMDLEFNPDNNYWVVKLSKGDHRLHTLLDQKDADGLSGGHPVRVPGGADRPIRKELRILRLAVNRRVALEPRGGASGLFWRRSQSCCAISAS